MFCESLSEFLKGNTNLREIDISCNLISESSATTLKSSLEGNKFIVSIDVRNNKLEEKTIEEINEIVLKNYLATNGISYKKLGDCKFIFHLILCSGWTDLKDCRGSSR